MKIIKTDIVGKLYPGDGNPRNSEGAFTRLEDGRIAYVFSRYIGNSAQDDARCNICAVYSNDNGNTFDTDNIETIVDASDYGFDNAMSVSLLHMHNGDIGLFYILKHNGFSSDYRLRRYKGSFDNFISETVCFPNNYTTYCIINNDRVIKLSDGSIIVIASFHFGDTAPDKHDAYLDMRGAVHTFISHDDGKTWQENFGVVKLDNTYSNTGLQEPGIIELPGGTLYAHARTDRMYQYEFVSIDKGQHWFGPQPSRFSSPDSPLLIKKNPHSGKYYAIWNPTPNYPGRGNDLITWGRSPYVIAESEDGVNFGEWAVIENDPDTGYCYPALYFLDSNTALLAHCNGTAKEGGMLNSSLIKKIAFE